MNVESIADESHRADRDAGQHKHAGGEIEEGQAALEEVAAGTELRHLMDVHVLALTAHLDVKFAVNQVFDAIGKGANAIDHAAQSAGSRQDESARGGNEQCGRDHRREHAQCGVERGNVEVEQQPVYCTRRADSGQGTANGGQRPDDRGQKTFSFEAATISATMFQATTNANSRLMRESNRLRPFRQQ